MKPIRGGLFSVGMAVVATSFVLGACGDESTEVTETNAVLPASECPEANTALAKAGLPVPDEYAPACPTPEELRRAIKGMIHRPPDALREALEKGLIHEGQDPKLYPPAVKQEIQRWEARHYEWD